MDKLPKLSEDTIKKLLDDPEVVEKIKKDLENISKKKPTRQYFHCEICRDTKKVLVCGGPTQDCPCCGPRY